MIILETSLKYAKPLIPLDLHRVEYITLHHIAHENATPEDIHKWHLNNGWSGFGYSEYIRKDGTVYIGRGDHVGAHTRNHNSISYGIACEGNFGILKRQPEQMPKAQFESLVTRLNYHRDRFPNPVEIVRHLDRAVTECPGEYFPFADIIKAVNNVHWAEAQYNSLIQKGMVIHEKRFDDNPTRGELFALLDQLTDKR